ncbi:MAG: outer membrane protein assembly factor BamA [Bacteroidota bacterium]
MKLIKYFFVISLIQLSLNNLFGQVKFDYANPKEYHIGGISITGVRYLNHNALVQLSGLKEGQKIKIPGEGITNSLKKLWKQGLFSDIKISYTKIVADTIYLDIYLQERPRLSRLVISGIMNAQIKDLEEKINLKRGGQVTENIINRTKNIISDYFIEKGYFNVDINIIQKNDTTYQNTVILYVNIDKKEKVKITEIDFEGNTVFEDAKLKKFLKETKQKRWYGLFKPSKYNPDKYEEDKKNLITKLNSKGYRDAKILGDTLIKNPDNTLKLAIKIEEGNQYFFRDITWVGNKKFTAPQLSRQLKIKKGDIYDQSVLDERLSIEDDAVSNLYMDDGYLFFNVTPVEMNIQNDSIDLEMRIFEGPQATIKNVTITGNTRTNDNVIRREIRTLPGELFRKSDIIRTVRELAQLGHFDPEQIVPTPKPNPSDGTVDLEYALVEKANDQIELSGGWGAGMIVGTLGLSFNNFSTKNIFDKKAWQPLPTGDGQKLSVRAQTNGKYYQNYSISFIEPWLGGKKPNSLSVSVSHTIQSRGAYNPYSGYGSAYGGYGSSYYPTDGSGSKMNITSASVGFGRRLKWPDDYFSLYNELSYRHYILNDYPYLFRGISDGDFNQIAFNNILSRSSVDQPLYSRRGSSFSLGLEFTLPISLWDGKDYANMDLVEKFKWLEYYKWDFKATWFTQLIGDLVFHAKAEYGFINYYNEDIGPAPTEAFVLGGDGMGYMSYGKTIVGLRGYENGSLSPQSGDYIYNKYVFELRYPIALTQAATIYGLTFLESGGSWNRFSDYNPFGLHRSGGVGVRVFLPMLGLLGIDWAYGFDKIPDSSEIGGSRFHFILGQQF